MSEVKLLEIKRIDQENGFTCGRVNIANERPILHCHDYYEFLMVTNGSICHIINSKKQFLSEGNLLFIRDFDVHVFLHENQNSVEYIYIAISKKLFSSIREYLGDDFPADTLIGAEDPPMVALTSGEKENVLNLVVQLNKINDKSASRLKVKTLLTDIFVNYFIDYDKKTKDVPVWLENTCEKMKKSPNFIEGTKKMLEISGKSREHLTRTLKKYYNMSASEFVNNLRLEYCIELITKTDKPIIDICYSCGFENLSWFYKIFEKKYGTTPAKYRKVYKYAKHPSQKL